MKYLKLFKIYEYNDDDNDEVPDITVDFKIGDHVKPIKNSGYDIKNDIFKDKIYTIIKIYSNEFRIRNFEHSTNPLDVCDIEDQDGETFKLWFLKRFKPAETEFQVNKYNI